jgi:hypothetical protein
MKIRPVGDELFNADSQTDRHTHDEANKDKAVPLQVWRGPEISRKLTFPDFMTRAQDDGKVVSLTHRPPLTQDIYT